MIHLSRINGTDFVLNCDMIKYMESTPDTIITLASGEKVMVREGLDDVIRLTMEYRKRLLQEPPQTKGA